jgi:hypothetical protein
VNAGTRSGSPARIDPGALQQAPDDDRAQLRGRHFGEGSTELSDRGAAGGNNDDVFHDSSWMGAHMPGRTSKIDEQSFIVDALP